MGLRAELEGLKRELNQVHRMRVEVRGTFQHVPRLDVLRPDKFKGSRVEKNVDNFLLNIDDYFK